MRQAACRKKQIGRLDKQGLESPLVARLAHACRALAVPTRRRPQMKRGMTAEQARAWRYCCLALALAPPHMPLSAEGLKAPQPGSSACCRCSLVSPGAV